MATPRQHLANAPAREALIDIQFEPHIDVDQIDQFIELAAPRFQDKSDLMQAQIGLSRDGTPPQTSHSIMGRRLDSADPPYVLQCRTGGFTFSRLSPYGEWKDLREAAREYWNLLCTVTQPEVVTRIAVRYINEIRLPLPINNFDEYLTCPPTIPAGLPQSLSGFLQRVIVPDEPNCCTSIVTQAIDTQPIPADNPATITVLLDIDVFRRFQLATNSTSEIWAGLDVLRTQKNRIFFEYLTDKTVELFV